MKDLYIVIPAYEPNERLLELLDNLNSSFNYAKIIIVNDGTEDKSIFQEAQEKPNVAILTHEVNKGKGEALKTAFRYLKNINSDMIIVTIDSDGQHKVSDMSNCIEKYKKIDEGILLGSRMFEGDIPIKSKIGNVTSRVLLRLFNNKHIYDSQTGLRVFNDKMLDFLINVKGSRFEYEMNMIVEAINNKIEINEVKIETIYFNNNSATHFRPVKDFIHICNSIIKYSIPYVFGLIVYILLYVLLRNVEVFDYFNVLIASLSYIAIPLVFNSLNICFGTRSIFKRFISYSLYNIIFLGINFGIIFGFNYLMNNVLSMILSLLITSILFFTFNYVTSKKKEVLI